VSSVASDIAARRSRQRDYTCLLSDAFLIYQDAAQRAHGVAADTVDDISRVLVTAYDGAQQEHTVTVDVPDAFDECFLPALAAALAPDESTAKTRSSAKITMREPPKEHPVPIANDVGGAAPPRAFKVLVRRDMRPVSMRLRLLKMSIEASALYLRVEAMRQVQRECTAATAAAGTDDGLLLVFRKRLPCMAAEHSLRTLAFVRNAVARALAQEERLIATEWPPAVVFRGVCQAPYTFLPDLFTPRAVAVKVQPSAML
jgi:hypothetical protein